MLRSSQIQKKRPKTLIFLIIISVTFSCIRQIEPPEWDINTLLPIAKSSISIYDIITDSSLQNKGGDSLFIVFDEKLDKVKLDTILMLDVDPFIRNIKLDSIRLNDQHINKTITLGDVIREEGDTTLLPDGSNSIIPPIPGVTVGPYTIDATEYFQSINLHDGVMDIMISNGFPVAINNITYQLSNTDAGTVIHSGNFPDLPAGNADSDSIDLAGKTIEGRMEIEFSFDIAGSGFNIVNIDYDDAVQTDITIRDMHIYEATAIFPAQTILHHKEVVYLENMEDMELTYGEIDSGKLRIRVVSTIEDETYFHYEIPNATKDDIPFEKDMVVPPAPSGGNITREFIFPFSGYQFDFTGKINDTTNAFYNELTGKIDSTGEQIFLTLEDSVDVIVEVLDMQPSFAMGYLGQHQISVGPDTISFNAFKNFNIDHLDLNNSKLKLLLNNEIGMEAVVTLKKITAKNSNNRKTIELNTAAMPDAYEINGASAYNPLKPENTWFEFNDQNANPSEFISILPDVFEYFIEIKTNPAGKTGDFDDFIHTDKGLNIKINAEIPLQLKINQLVLSDTVELLTNDTIKTGNINNGIYYLLVNNSFPLEAYISFYFIDNKQGVFDSIIFQDPVKPAKVSKESYIVTDPTFTKLDFAANNERTKNILSADKTIIRAMFNTKPDNKHLQLFSTYMLDIKLTGDINFEINGDH